MQVNIKQSLIRNKNTIIYSTILFILMIGGFLIWYFYVRIDDSELHSLESKIQSNQDVKKYFSNLSFSTDDQQKPVTNQGLSSYPYQLIGNYNKEFSQLSGDDKISIFTEVQDVIKGNGELVNCGYKKYCSVSKIDVMNADTNKIDIYSFDTAIGDITHTYNDQNGVPQTETISSTDSSSNSDSSNSDTNSNTSTDNSSTSEQGQPTETNPSDSTSTDTTSQTTPQVGMTADEVRATSWGEPADINKTTTADGVSEQWVYYNPISHIPDRYVYLDNGIVTSIQESN